MKPNHSSTLLFYLLLTALSCQTSTSPNIDLTNNSSPTATEDPIVEVANTPVENQQAAIDTNQIEETPEIKEKKAVKVDHVAEKKTSTQNSKTPAEFAQIIFFKESFNFGDITEGDSLEIKFEFYNSGGAPLLIKSVDPSCGCTIPSYPDKPIEKNGRGSIDVLYKSAGKIGRQSPTIAVVTNSKKNAYSILKLEGVVYPMEKDKTESGG